ncbi:unnamed protein product, partial [Sphagnum jensenii]
MLKRNSKSIQMDVLVCTSPLGKWAKPLCAKVACYFLYRNSCLLLLCNISMQV